MNDVRHQAQSAHDEEWRTALQQGGGAADLPDTAIPEVADRGPSRDGALVVNIRLIDGRLANFFAEGEPIAFEVFDR